MSPKKGRNEEPVTARDQIYMKFDGAENESPKETPEAPEALKSNEAEVEVPSEPEATEEPTPVAEKEPVAKTEVEKEPMPIPKPAKKWMGRFESPEEMERYAFERDQAFNQLKQYIDWDKLKSDMGGGPRNQPFQQQVQQPSQQVGYPDKDAFFADFANRGHNLLDERYLTDQRLDTKLSQLVPALTQTISFRVKLDDAYEEFMENYPHLIEFEEQVGKKAWELMGQNHRLSPRKAMRDAVKHIEDLLNQKKEEGKKEAQTLHKEKKLENLPPTQAGKDKIGPIKPPAPEEEEPPESLDDYIKERRKWRNQTTMRGGGFRQK